MPRLQLPGTSQTLGSDKIVLTETDIVKLEDTGGKGNKEIRRKQDKKSRREQQKVVAKAKGDQDAVNPDLTPEVVVRGNEFGENLKTNKLGNAQEFMQLKSKGQVYT